ncbi:hypothetical protein BGZ70_005867, partial [Mortierella alpina]
PAMISPFDLPEIRSHLAPFLTSDDLPACAAVSKDWSSTYAPLLYRTCSVVYYSSKNPTPSTLLKYADSIRRLRFSGIDFSQASSSIAALIKQNPNLKHLQFLDQPALSSIELWNAVAGCTNLSSLQFLRCSMSPAHIPAFWKACSNLQTLEIQSLKLLMSNGQDWPDQPSGIRFPRLQVLTMTSISGISLLTQLEIVTLSPILKSLDWNMPRNAEMPSDELRLCIQKRLWPSLRELSLYTHISDDDLYEVLEVMKEAQRLYLPSARFGPKSFQSFMIHHSKTIRHLNLYCSPTLTGAMVHNIMSNCPMLEELAAPSLRGTDLIRFTLEGLNETTEEDEDASEAFE